MATACFTACALSAGWLLPIVPSFSQSWTISRMFSATTAFDPPFLSFAGTTAS
jgi:hypothetical protein